MNNYMWKHLHVCNHDKDYQLYHDMSVRHIRTFCCKSGATIPLIDEQIDE